MQPPSPHGKSPSRKPPPLRKPRIYYGWYVLGISMASSFLAAGTGQLFLGVMLRPMAEDTGWSRSEIAGAATAGTVVAGFVAVLSGRLADRYGPRVLVTVGIIGVTIGYMVMASSEVLGVFYLGYVLGRVMGQSAIGGVVGRTTAVNWFRRMRGRTMGMVQMAFPLGGGALSFGAQLMMNGGVHWKSVFVVYGVIMLATVLVPAALVLRRRPEDIGLLPDGDWPGDPQTPVSTMRPATPPQVEEYGGWTLREALRTRTLWLITASITGAGFATGGVSFHIAAYLGDQGVAATAAAAAISTYALTGAVANGAWGFAAERYSERVLAMGAIGTGGLLTLAFLFVDNAATGIAFGALYGLATRGEGSLIMMMIATYYGRRSFGTISGFTQPFQMAGLGAGPLAASLAFDLSGSYTGVFLVMVAIYVVVVAMLWVAKRPTPREALAPEPRAA